MFIKRICQCCQERIIDTFLNILTIAVYDANGAETIYDSNELLFIFEAYTDKYHLHISPTQMILTRPDLILFALKEYNSTTITWTWSNITLCETCYEKQKELFPII